MIPALRASRELEGVLEPRRATTLLHPLRLRLLALAQQPLSGTEMALRLGLPRQRVNYHVRALERADFLRRAGRKRKRNMTEQRYVAGARAYVLSPEMLGPLAAGLASVEDRDSAARLVALASQVQSDLLRESGGARPVDETTLSLTTELRFESTPQRRAFAEALLEALVSVLARHSSPAAAPDGRPGGGRPYRLILGCYPVRAGGDRA